MRKVTVIATCLVNMRVAFKELAQAELAVRNIFGECFPKADFDAWNQDINDGVAANIIRNVGKASRIDVELFIRDLWE